MKPDIALIFLQGLGNSIINFPIYFQLRKKFEINVITYNNGSSKFYESMGANVTKIDSLVDIFRKCLKIKCSSAASFYPNWRRELCALNFVQAPLKLHFKSKPFLSPLFIGTQVPSISTRHDFENNCELFSYLGLDFDSSMDLSQEMDFKTENPSSYVIIHPTASTKFKYYPASFWKEVIAYLESQFDEIYFISGTSQDEMKFVEELMVPNSRHLAGLDFMELSKVIANCKLFIGLDSSMMHLASIFKRTVVALWSFADFRRIYPYTPDSSIYLPREVLTATKFKYPDQELPWLRRASASDIIEIIQKNRNPDILNTDKASNEIKIYTY